jgi:hypothetical protein
LVNRSLDFSNRAHAGKLSAMRFGVNAAKLRGAAEDPVLHGKMLSIF